MSSRILGREETFTNRICETKKRPDRLVVAGSFDWADVAELADALDSKSSTRESVWVRPPPSAPSQILHFPSILRGKMSFSVFAVCAFVRFLTFADFSKTMLRKHTKSIQNESSGSPPGIWRGVSDAFRAHCRALAVFLDGRVPP